MSLLEGQASTTWGRRAELQQEVAPGLSLGCSAFQQGLWGPQAAPQALSTPVHGGEGVWGSALPHASQSRASQTQSVPPPPPGGLVQKQIQQLWAELEGLHF